MYEYLIKSCRSTYRVRAKRHSYWNNKRLAVQLMCVPENEPFGTITVNIDYPLSGRGENLAFVDTNNFPEIEWWLQDNRIAVPTGHYGESGFCSYPEYRFDLSKLVE